ncbi:MAG: ATP-binding protein [Tistlia sp.]|uniref:sensor histidine kinase n=1 Tax=Tistlia sp. TaxID=3057121 RepID=UPI0034A30B04
MARAIARRFHLATGCLVLLFLASGGLLLGYLGHSLDRQAAEQSAHLATTAVRQLEASDLSHVYDFAYWDDSVAFARGERDRFWADENLGPWSMATYGFTGAFVLGADDSLLYAAFARDRGSEGEGEGEAGEIEALPPGPLLGEGLARLTEAARAAPMDDATPARAYFRQGDEVFLAVAAAITSEYPSEAELQRGPRPVLLYVRRLDEALLADLAARYLLPDLRLMPTDGVLPQEASGQDRLALEGPDGQPAALLAWAPPRPSADALARAALPGALALLLLLALVGAILMATRLAGRTIAGTVEALERSNAELLVGERLAREARDEAERANRVKTVFLANVGHELRTPLNAVLGFSDLIRRQVKGPIGDPAYRTYAEDIHAGGEHLLRLIDNILDLSRIEVGAWDLDPTPVDLRAATEEVLRFLAPLAEKRSIELAVELEDAPGSIVADRRALAQIVTNLVGNAIKFTDAGGRVRVRWIRGEARGEPGTAVLQVLDSGVGISPGDLEAILLPFERGSDPVARRREGSGLGLAIVKSLVELHGGRLEIDSAPGEGTCVTVLLPAPREAVAA